MSSNYNKGIYEQLEQVLNKLDKMMIENRKQSQTIQELKKIVSKLEDEKTNINFRNWKTKKIVTIQVNHLVRMDTRK